MFAHAYAHAWTLVYMHAISVRWISIIESQHYGGLEFKV